MLYGAAMNLAAFGVGVLILALVALVGWVLVIKLLPLLGGGAGRLDRATRDSLRDADRAYTQQSSQLPPASKKAVMDGKRKYS